MQPDNASAKISSTILAVGFGLVMFLGIAFALKCMRGAAAGEVGERVH